MSDFTTLRVGQLVEEVWSGTDKLPHEVGTELKRGTVANLATYIASVIDASAGLAFNPLKISDGQTLPATTDNEWILAGKGTYLQGGGFPNVVCTDDINVVTSNGISWAFSFGVNIEGFDDSNVVHKTGNETIEGIKSFKKSIVLDSDEPLDAKYLNGKVAYASLAEANTLIPIGIRSPYLKIVVQGAEYWWADGAWVLKLPTITGTRIIDAYSYGFSHAETGQNNSIAINNALALGGKIIVSIPGIYEIDDSIVLPSNTAIEFVKGCTLKHVTPSIGRFVNTFKNKGCETSTGNDNISIIGNGLIIDFNGHDGIEGGATLPFAYQNGRISFYKVTNFNVSGIYVNDPQETYGMYFFEMTNCSYGKITDIDLERYPKDGIDMIHCHDIHIKNYLSTTGDDAIFMGSGWLGYDKSIGDTYNITIENWISDGIFTGVPSRIITSSWDDWQSGRTYAGSSEDASELCVNAGRVYRKTTNGNQVASNAPTHSTGTVTGADGIGWLVVSDTVKYTNDVYNIRYINCQAINSSGSANWYYESPTVSQNTHTAILKDVYFDNCAFISDSGVKIADYSCFINASANISNLNIFNTTVSFKENTANLGYNSFITLNQNSAGNKTDVDNINICNLNFKGFYKASRFINNLGNILTLGNVNINKSEIEVESDSNSSIILVSNKDNLKTLNISNSTIRGIGMLLFFNGSNWTPPIERVVNISNTNFFNCKKIFTHQYSYPLGMNIYYNSFGCTFTDTVNWILDNETGDASMIILNFLGNKTNTPSKIMQFPLQYTKKLFDLDDGLAVVKDAIVNGVTTIAPSQNAVFDALALKQNTITNPITGSPSTGYIPKSNGGGVIANSLIYDTNTSVGIGTIAPYRKLTVQHTGSAYLGVNDTTNSKYSFGSEANGLVFFDDSRAAYLALFDKVNGNFLINTTSLTDTTNKLQVNGSVKSTQYRLSALNTAPASATDTGTLGEIRYDTNYMYVCVATNTWKRSPLTTW